MATQGLVTVVSGEQVLMKIVAGDDGYNASKLARKLKSAWPCTAQEAYDLALDAGFGSLETLVVITDSAVVSEEPVSDLHHTTFQQPRFNPRWEHGIADHVKVIQV